jgi:hypothetical protein
MKVICPVVSILDDNLSQNLLCGKLENKQDVMLWKNGSRNSDRDSTETTKTSSCHCASNN